VDLRPPLFVFSFLAVSLIALYLAGAAWRRSRTPGSLSFTLLMLAVSIWLFATAGSLSMDDLAAKIFWAKVTYSVTAWVGLLWFSFAFEYTHPESRIIEKWGGWLWVVPMLTCLLTFTNEFHGLVWPRIDPAPAGSTALIFSRGPWFWVHVFYNYTLIALGAFVLLHSVIRQSIYHRRQVLALVLGMMFPWMANISYLMGWTPRPSFDLTPFAFAISGILYAWTLFSMRLFDSIPLVREVILEHIGEGYLALDRNNRVLDANLLARKFLHLDQGSLCGLPAWRVLENWPGLLNLLESKSAVQMELTAISQPLMVLEASLAPWYNRAGQLAGRLLILDDVTRRKQVEEQLRDSERLYRLLVNASPVGIIMTDAKGVITFASPEAYELHGGNQDNSAIGKSVLDLVHPDDRFAAVTRVSKILHEKEKLSPHQYRILRRDDSYFWGEITSTPLLTEQGNVYGMLTILRDVSQRKDLEMRLESHLKQQTFINDLLQILYRPPDFDAALKLGLERIGLFTHSSRVYLCENSPDGKEAWIRLEWCSESSRPRSQEAPLFRYAEIESWTYLMETQGIIQAPLLDGRRPEALKTEIPDDIADFMQTWNVQSLVALPIYGKEEGVYGFLGFDECCGPPRWNNDDVHLLQNVCKLISGAFAKKQVEEAEMRQRILAQALRDTASVLNSTLNYEEVLDRILANLERVTRHDSASIAVVEENDVVRFVRWRGYNAGGSEWMSNARIPLNERVTYQIMAKTGQPIILSDTREGDVWKNYKAVGWIRSYAGAPILIQGVVVGFINLDSITPNFFTPDLAEHLQVFADQAAVAIQNSRLYDSVHRRADEMSTLYKIGLILTSGLELEKVLLSLLDQCRKVLPVDIFYVALYESETGMIDHALYYKDGTFHTIEPRSLETNPGMSGAIIRTGKTIYLPDSTAPEVGEKYKIVRTGGKLARSYLGAPLILRDQVIGVLSIQSFQPHAFEPEKVRLLETIATQASIAVQNARLYEQMRQMAITDPVTLLFTRRHFSMLGSSEVERSVRYNRPLSVLMVDIDHFKIVNDTYGHNAGDHVLQSVARSCCLALRATDIVGRWGGEEFTIVLPEADQAGAGIIAERIRCMVEGNEIGINNMASVCVTVSLGIAVLTPECKNLEALVDRADIALYAAKQAGRNQVKIYSELDCAQVISAGPHSGILPAG
jgi:diguanylate cyclase (GGDEF)-like protein/PAS domain S-box-containing protein